MKSSRERMRKDEMQLTISRMPLAMESKRALPSAPRETQGQLQQTGPTLILAHWTKQAGQRKSPSGILALAPLFCGLGF